MRTAVRTMTPPKPESGGNGWSSAVVSVRMKSLVEGTIVNEPTDQKVGDSSSSERASKSPGSGLPKPRSAGGRFARPYKNPYSCRDELDL